MTSPAPPRELTLLDLLTVLLRHRRLVVGLPLVVGILTAVVSLLVTPTYTATASFAPEESAASKLPAGLAGLAGQFGLSVGADASRSPRFYAEVLQSRPLLERALASRYVDPRGETDSVRLLDILKVRGRDADDSMFNGVRALRKLVATRVDNQTNIVRVSVMSRYPEMAADIANRLLAYLNDFNAQARQSQAGERRKFVEQRLVETEADLRTAENDLRAFLERNRTWQQSPQLVFEEGRLRRQLDIRQEVYLTLKREFETARIEEVNDTPVITVVDAATPPHLRSRPRRTLMVGLGILFGAVLGVFGAFGVEYVQRMRRDDASGYQDFVDSLSPQRSAPR